MNNRQRLIDIISEHKLDRLTVAEMLKVKRATIDHWLLSPESKSHEQCPDMAIELLELKLGIDAVDERPKESGL
jgi:hypothetical protein